MSTEVKPVTHVIDGADVIVEDVLVRCDSGGVSTQSETADESGRSRTNWLTLPDVAEMIGETTARVRRLIDEHHLVALRRDGVLRVPELFLLEGRPLASLRGTIIVLQDAGFSDEELVDWLLEPDETIGMPPIDALRAGRKSEVRRVAQTLA